MSLEKYYSYFKRIYVELQDYTFEHNPSDHKQRSSRFLGRKKLIQRIKNILNRSSTKSGAYLITGFRGIGKSSLLNKVIYDLEPELIPHKFKNRLHRLLFFSVAIGIILHYFKDDIIQYANKAPIDIIFLSVLLISLLLGLLTSLMFNRNHKNRIVLENLTIKQSIRFFWILILTLVLIQLNIFQVCKSILSWSTVPWLFLSVLFLNVIKSGRKNDAINIKSYGLRSTFDFVFPYKKVLSVFDLRSEKYLHGTVYYWMQDVVFVCMTLAFVIRRYPEWIEKDILTFGHTLTFTICAPLVMIIAVEIIKVIDGALRCFKQLIVNVIVSGYPDPNKRDQIVNPIIDAFKALWLFIRNVLKQFYRKVKNRFIFAKRFHNRINLGQDELNEVDVLKMIVNSIRSSYSRIGSSGWAFPFGLANKVTSLVLVLYVTGSIYTLPEVSEATYSFKQRIGYFDAFPNQSRYPKNLEKEEKQSNMANEPLSLKVVFPTGTKVSEPSILKELWNGLGTVFIKCSNYADDTFMALYEVMKSQFPISKLVALEAVLFEGKRFRLFPSVPDYLFLMIFFAAFVLAKKIMMRKPFGLITHSVVRMKLENLNDRINASVHKESVSGLGFFQSYVNIFKKRSKVYPIADAREIESELIDILNHIQRVPIILHRPEFVFIFDELDKIEAHHNASIEDKENEGVSKSKAKDSSRERRLAISKILANLKHFLTTADAKFVFIAGREMYDAHLADISDRNYFLGSIFHDVIYVPSFLTDNTERASDAAKNSSNHMSYHTTLVEEFVCQKLIPREFNGDGKSWSLKTFKEYLVSEFLPTGNAAERDYVKYQIDYTILVLRNFINYLQYRSSGAPKKISFLLESYIQSYHQGKMYDKEFINENSSVIFGKRKDNFYLAFGYHDCYTFGLNNYLTTPFLHNISRQINQYSDKLMVSTTYILDHLYKFHNSGFSWRNLEVTPEIIDVNKAPSLRRLISDIVTFLSYYHLEHVVSGLYDFKFNARLTIEMDYFSKVNERESAAYNFTLDESLEVKKHYNRKLADISSKYDPEIKRAGGMPYVHSLGFIHGNIGDLHYYDQEYDDAIIEFKEAVQLLRHQRDNGQTLTIDQLVVLTRLFLKLAIALEKKKSYASAYLICENVTELIYDYFFGEPTAKFPGIAFQMEAISKNSVRGAIGLLFQPFMVKIHIKEKEKSKGISNNDVQILEDQLRPLVERMNSPEQLIFKAEYNNKVGDLLFYKNYTCDLGQSQEEAYCFSEYYKKTLEAFVELENLQPSSHTGVLSLVNDLYFVDLNLRTCRQTFKSPLKIVANNLSDIGDTIYAKCNHSDYFNSLNEVIDAVSKDGRPLNVNVEQQLANVITLYRYSASIYRKNDDPKKASFQLLKVLYLLEMGIPNSVPENKNQIVRQLVNFDRYIKENIVVKAIRYILMAYDSSSLTEAMRIGSIFKMIDQDLFGNTSEFSKVFGQIPAYTEIQDILSVYAMIKAKLSKFYYDCGFQHGPLLSVMEAQQIDAFKFVNRNMGSMLSRIIKLQYKSKLNQLHLCYILNFKESWLKVTYEKIDKIDKKDVDRISMLKYLIADSIYCQSQIIRILKTCGPSYLTSHSLFAEAYGKKGKWCELLEYYEQIFENMTGRVHINQKIREKVKELITSRALDTINVEYNYHKALSNFTLMEEMHNQGFAYQRTIENMHYLNDDYDDDNFHFYAAFDRYLISSGRINRRVEKLKDELVRLKKASYRFKEELFFD